MPEQFQNFAYGTTTAGISSVTNPCTIQLNGGAGASFPSVYPFRVTVGGTGPNSAVEVMIVTTRTTDTLTAFRGTSMGLFGALEVPAPTLQGWSAGSIVSNNLSAGAMIQIQQQIQPTIVAPQGFNLVDGIGGAVLSTDLYGFTLNVPSAGGNNVIYAATTLTNTATYSATFGFRGLMNVNNFAQVGPMITDGTNIITWRFNQSYFAGDFFFWTSFNNPSSQISSWAMTNYQNPGVMCRVVADGTNRIWSLGDWRMRQWIPMLTQSAGANLTETKVGFFALSNNGTNCMCEAFHYSQS